MHPYHYIHLGIGVPLLVYLVYGLSTESDVRYDADVIPLLYNISGCTPEDIKNECIILLMLDILLWLLWIGTIELMKQPKMEDDAKFFISCIMFFLYTAELFACMGVLACNDNGLEGQLYKHMLHLWIAVWIHFILNPFIVIPAAGGVLGIAIIILVCVSPARDEPVKETLQDSQADDDDASSVHSFTLETEVAYPLHALSSDE